MLLCGSIWLKPSGLTTRGSSAGSDFLSFLQCGSDQAGSGFPMDSDAQGVCDWEGKMQWIAGQFLPAWVLVIEWVKLMHESYGNLVDSIEQGCGPVARFSFCEGCACDQCCVFQCDGFDGCLRDLCQYCGGDMPVSPRDEADSLDSTVCGTGGGDVELAPPEQQSDCWSVLSGCEEESASVAELAVLEDQIECWSVSLECEEEAVSENTVAGEGWW